MGRPKKIKEATEPTTPQAPPQALELGLPVGVMDYVTFLIQNQPSGRPIMQSSPRGMLLAAEIKDAEEMARRALTEEDRVQVQTRAPKVRLLPGEVAELNTYPTSDGRFYHPAQAFLSSLIDAFWATKAVWPGSKTRESAEKVLIRTARAVHDQAILFNPDTMKPYRATDNPLGYFVDVRTAVNRNTGDRIIASRPAWKRWGVLVTMSFDNVTLTKHVLRQGLQIAGTLVGAGVFRPLPPRNMPPAKQGKGGPFGTFIADFWDKPIPKDLQPEI